MLWDPGFDSWRHYGVTGQPAFVLIDRQGNAQAGWLGQFDETQLLNMAAALA